MTGREEIVAAARGWIGTPYRHQGRLKGVGCDCLGLLIGVFREASGGGAVGPIPPYTRDWAEAAGRETLREGLLRVLTEIRPAEARAGDVLLFRWRAGLPAKHAGILVAPDRMVHAQEGARVAEVALSPWWRRRAAYGFAFDDPTASVIAGRPAGA
jgi:NlpC/P60 family putative phage cell wall peptidase